MAVLRVFPVISVRRSRPLFFAIAILVAGACGCETGRHSAAGFRLPPDGDAARGRDAFLALECHRCHAVAGERLPAPTVEPPVPVVLGGERAEPVTDGYLVASIIYPNARLAPYPRNQITAGGVSRMPDYRDRLTVRQLTDIVAFLQSRYTVRQLPSRYAYR